MSRAMLSCVGLFFLATSLHAVDDASQEELKRLRGEWRLVERVVDGTPRDIELLWTIAGNEISQGPEIGVLAEFKIDATTKPKQIDVTMVSKLDPKNLGKTLPGVYEIDGDVLRICGQMQDDVKERPKVLESKAGSGLTLLVFERVADKPPVEATILSKGDLTDDDDVLATFLVEVTARHKDFRMQQKVHLQISKKTKLMKQVGEKQEPVDVASLTKGVNLHFSGYREVLESEPVIVTPELVVLTPVK